MRWRANVVQSLGLDSGHHEKVRNSPENMIHMREVTFWGSAKVSVFDRLFLEGFGGPPVGPQPGRGYMDRWDAA
jgi:hypothetical protein